MHKINLTSINIYLIFLIKLLIVLVLGTTNSFSQDAPKIPEQIKPFYQICGTFEGEAEGTWGGQSFKSKVTHVNSKAADGYAIYEDETTDMGAMGTYKAIGMFGYDLGTDMIHFYAISNFNDVHDHAGKWIDNNTFSVQHSGTRDGKPFAEQILCTIISSNEYKFSVNEYCGGLQTFMMNVSMKRKK